MYNSSIICRFRLTSVSASPLYSKRSTIGKSLLRKQLAVAGALLMAALSASTAKADVMAQYTWSPNTYFVENKTGDTEVLSGGFVWDLTTDSLVSIDTTLTGADLTTTFIAPPEYVDFYNHGLGWITQESDGSVLQVGFASDLGLGLTDRLSSQTYGVFVSSPSFANDYDSYETGGVTASPVPEPAAMATMVVGLAALGFARRRRV